jgi:hypothetical protein
MNGWTRLFIVAGAVAGLTWLAGPYVSGELGAIRDQVNVAWGNRNHAGFAPVWNPLGARPDSGNDRYGSAPAWFPSQADGRWRGGDQAQPGTYRRCSFDGRHLTCDDRQDGAPPPRDGRR